METGNASYHGSAARRGAVLSLSLTSRENAERMHSSPLFAQAAVGGRGRHVEVGGGTARFPGSRPPAPGPRPPAPGPRNPGPRSPVPGRRSLAAGKGHTARSAVPPAPAPGIGNSCHWPLPGAGAEKKGD